MFAFSFVVLLIALAFGNLLRLRFVCSLQTLQADSDAVWEDSNKMKTD